MTELAGLKGRMRPRDPGEAHRVATPLELLFDLTFVVAVARVAAQLAHDIGEGHVADGLGGYLMVFFAIWWAWMNFTWFASAYDIDDAPYRLLTLVQMTGVLILAAGVPAAFEERDFTTVVVGYVVMRIALVGQWLRAAASDPEHRKTALQYAAGIFVVQLGWVARLWLPDELGVASFLVLAAADVSIPMVAERQGMTPWHPHHIAERYGLFTIIVLGESVTAASMAISSNFDANGVTLDLVMLSGGGLLLLFGMWWVYFAHDAGEGLRIRRHLSFVWGYLHYFLTAAAAAVGATLEAAVELSLHHGEVSGRTVALTVAFSVSIFVGLSVYLHHRLIDQPTVSAGETAVAVAGLLLVAFFVGAESVPLALLLQGLVLAGLVAAIVVRGDSRLQEPA